MKLEKELNHLKIQIHLYSKFNTKCHFEKIASKI